MVMRRQTTTEKDGAGNVTRTRHRYVDMPGGDRAPVGIGGGPGSRAAERGDVAPSRFGESSWNGPEAASRPGAPFVAGELREQERAAGEAQIAAAREEGRQEGREALATMASGMDKVADLTAESQRLKKREAVLMDQVDKLSGEVSKLQQRAEKTDGDLLRLRDKLEQISTEHGQRIDRIENDLGVLGDAAAIEANATRD